MSDESLVINFDANGNSYYCRRTSNETSILQNKIQTAYGSGECLVTASGMAAITAILQGLTFYDPDKKFNIIYGDEMYCDVDKVCKTIARSQNITLHKVNIRKVDTIVNLFRSLADQNNIFFIESCTNPNGYIFDFSIIPELQSLSGTFTFIVDNTWLTHTVFSPFDHGADFVILSLTKYYSGGHAIGGAILSSPINSSKSTMDNIKTWLSFIGHHVSPHNSCVINSHVDSISDRIASSYNLTEQVIAYLQSNTIVSEILHPAVHSGDLCRKYFKKNGPSIITFYVQCTNNNFRDLKKRVPQLRSIDVITSYGSAVSRLDPYIKFISGSNGKKVVLFRLALGYEDTYEHVVAGLDELLTICRSYRNVILLPC